MFIIHADVHCYKCLLKFSINSLILKIIISLKNLEQLKYIINEISFYCNQYCQKFYQYYLQCYLRYDLFLDTMKFLRWFFST